MASKSLLNMVVNIYINIVCKKLFNIVCKKLFNMGYKVNIGKKLY
jgi:hypothetical protein